MNKKQQPPRPDTSKNGLLKKFPQSTKDHNRNQRMNKIISKLKSIDVQMEET